MPTSPSTFLPAPTRDCTVVPLISQELALVPQEVS